jgi:hypothetical protein
MSRRVAAFRPVVEGLEDRVVPYSVTGYQWGSTTVTASFMPDGSTTNTGATTNLFSTLNASHATETWQREFARALQTWANATKLNFYFVSDSGAASGTVNGSQGDIRLTMSPRSDSYAGYTYYPSGSSLGGDMFLSSNYGWNIGQHIDLYSVVLHELGHSLGLGHSDVGGAVMAPTIGTVYSGLSSDDIAGIQSIYGIRQNDSYDSGSGNNGFGTATSVSLNSSGVASFNADLTSMGDVDYYKLTAPANASGTLTVSVDASDISLLTGKVSVYDASFNLLGTASASTYEGKATLNLTGLTAGATYYVVADGATSDVFGMGAYKLSAQFGQGTAQPSLSIGNVSAAEGNSGTKQFNFTVSLSAASSSTVTVQYATANGSASSSSDYTSTSGTLTFAAGETQKTVTVLVNGDSTVESNETFVVNLSSAANATIGTSQGTGTIQNDDVPTVSIGNVSVNEGNSGTTQFNFTVSLSAASESTVTVQYATANGSATAGSDYTATSGTVTFAAGETQKTVTVLANGDTTVESNETFAVNLSSPSNATLGTSQGTGTITNDDSPTLSIGNVSVSEGNSGTTQLTFTVALSVASADTVTVQYATANGSASSSSDYTATSGTLTFAPGETEKTITVTIAGDTAIESNETFTVTLSSPSNATIGTSEATGTITNDDYPTVSIGNVSVNEGNSGTTQLTFTVSLSAASPSTVTVQYATANGSATAGSDYTSTSGTLTFAAGETQKTVTVLVNGDTEVESNETFTITLSSPTDATLGTSEGEGTIQNDDAASQPSLSIGNVSVSEGNSGTTQLTFTVSLSASSSSTVTAQYATANGSATAGSDYTATSGTLTFAPGETEKTISVAVTGDVTAESNETFTVTLSSPSNATLGTGEGTGTITNDDLAADRFEANNTASRAKNFGRTDSISQGNLNLHTTTDKDFYLFTTSQSGTYTFTVTRTQGAGRLDVAILNGTQKLIASGYSGSGGVTLTLTFVAGKKYYVRTASSTGSTIGYTLGVARSGGGGVDPGHGTLPSGIPLVGEYDPDHDHDHDHDHEETESGKQRKHGKVKHADGGKSKLFLAPETNERHTQKLNITDSASDALFGFPII